jgi:hypothetical protein
MSLDATSEVQKKPVKPLKVNKKPKVNACGCCN